MHMRQNKAGNNLRQDKDSNIQTSHGNTYEDETGGAEWEFTNL